MRKFRIPYIPYRSLLLSTTVLNDIKDALLISDYQCLSYCMYVHVCMCMYVCNVPTYMTVHCSVTVYMCVCVCTYVMYLRI